MSKKTLSLQPNTTTLTMTLEQAFEQLISQRAWYSGIKDAKGNIMTPQYAQDIKKRHKAGTLGDDVKRKLLIQSGKYYRREYWYLKSDDEPKAE